MFLATYTQPSFSPLPLPRQMKELRLKPRIYINLLTWPQQILAQPLRQWNGSPENYHGNKRLNLFTFGIWNLNLHRHEFRVQNVCVWKGWILEHIWRIPHYPYTIWLHTTDPCPGEIGIGVGPFRQPFYSAGCLLGRVPSIQQLSNGIEISNVKFKDKFANVQLL